MLLARAGVAAGGGFTVVSTFTANSTWTCPAGVTEVEYLVVAGGGGGGSNAGGGGGAGGFRTGTGLSVTAGTDYTITVGGGGSQNTNGNDSIFSTITSTAGGKGGHITEMLVQVAGQEAVVVLVCPVVALVALETLQ